MHGGIYHLGVIDPEHVATDALQEGERRRTCYLLQRRLDNICQPFSDVTLATDEQVLLVKFLDFSHLSGCLHDKFLDYRH